jgi:glycosyltransferase involved in cell wall biosynthesis
VGGRDYPGDSVSGTSVAQGHDGPAQPVLVRYAAELWVSPYCHFTGYIADANISRYLSTTDIAVDLDLKTAWSDKSTMNKMLDYMFFGCPIVAFDLKESRFSAQASALYVTPNSEAEMARTIEISSAMAANVAV